MFDLSSSKLLLLGIIALLVVGPKDLPGLLRSVGRYVGMMKRQAAEFRHQFDEAMKESELAELKQQVQDFGRETQSALNEAETSFRQEMASVESEAQKSLAAIDEAANAAMVTDAGGAVPPPAAETTPALAAPDVFETLAPSDASAAVQAEPSSVPAAEATPPARSAETRAEQKALATEPTVARAGV